MLQSGAALKGVIGKPVMLCQSFKPMFYFVHVIYELAFAEAL